MALHMAMQPAALPNKTTEQNIDTNSRVKSS